MNEMAATIAVARIGWQILAKIPWLSGWFLKRAFPISECKSRFQLRLCGNHSVFEFLSIRPMHSLSGLDLHALNMLPCDVHFEATRISGTVEGCKFMDEILNISHLIPVAGSSRIAMPEFGLTEQQVSWLRKLSHDYIRVKLVLYWQCNTIIHKWEGSGEFEFPIYIRRDPVGSSER